MMRCVCGGGFGLLAGTEEVQYVRLSPSLSLLPPPVFEGRRSLCYLSLVRLVTEKLEIAVLLELITSTFLTLLCLCCRFIQILSCCDNTTCVYFLLTHMYIKCIYVYTCAIHAIRAIYYCDYY